MRSRNVAVLATAIALSGTTAVVASAIVNTRADTIIPAGAAVDFAGTGWRCVNHHGYFTCQHGTDRPYVDLTSRHAGNFVVTVHPVAGSVGAPQKTHQQGDLIPVYIFSSTLK